MRLKTALMAGALAGAVLTGLSGLARAAGITDSEIVLGTHLDLSGPVAAAMPQLRNGMQMRFDEANEAGGINGRKIRLIVEDNGSQPQLAVRATDKLIRSDGVFAIVNAFGSGTNAAVVKRAVDAGVIYFSPWGAAAVLQKISGRSPLLFTTTADYDTTANAGLGWLIDENKAKKVGFIFQEGPLGELTKTGVVAALESRGMKLAAEASYKVGDIDFSSQVARMKAADVDIIFAATLTRETVGVMSEVKKLGWDSVKVLTTIPGRTIVVAEIGKGAVESLSGIGTWYIWPPGAEPADVKVWQEKYRKLFKIEPDENAFLAYAYSDWFVKYGLQAAGRDITAEKVVKGLQSSTYTDSPIFYGPKRFKNNHIDPETVQISQVKKGVWMPISGMIDPK
ncbi:MULTISPECIES: ABC transporter substrate-binding protein [unclassified Beijerinckia]|uniref:ABC transporter substrate-binding protein n=1 Tax=unclassified Beijerinckia TaxID=2638183 RepID=UPI0008951B47|nr:MULTISPECIES: ABC transporter substrate-binding protein [unclassified Beijerinckia]MDH7796313.1 branched-chain amino acid transport system substrate-binding protein [Beijerinckia sp. GAS462]SEC39541.1 amino acid/amide ABC transporter substrate-binding protein, HAAT family [Beijerinckia sp. 28-YEA-48]